MTPTYGFAQWLAILPHGITEYTYQFASVLPETPKAIRLTPMMPGMRVVRITRSGFTVEFDHERIREWRGMWAPIFDDVTVV